MGFYITTPSSEKIFNQPSFDKLDCVEYLETIKLQKRIITALDVALLKKQSTEFNTKVVQPLAPQFNIFRGMTFSVTELQLLINSAGADNCPYIRMYFGLDSEKLSVFILPVDQNLKHILSANTVCVGDLPCPPRTGCPNDSIVT